MSFDKWSVFIIPLLHVLIGKINLVDVNLIITGLYTWQVLPYGPITEEMDHIYMYIHVY